MKAQALSQIQCKLSVLSYVASLTQNIIKLYDKLDSGKAWWETSVLFFPSIIFFFLAFFVEGVNCWSQDLLITSTTLLIHSCFIYSNSSRCQALCKTPESASNCKILLLTSKILKVSSEFKWRNLWSIISTPLKENIGFYICK